MYGCEIQILEQDVLCCNTEFAHQMSRDEPMGSHLVMERNTVNCYFREIGAVNLAVHIRVVDVCADSRGKKAKRSWWKKSLLWIENEVMGEYIEKIYHGDSVVVS